MNKPSLRAALLCLVPAFAACSGGELVGLHLTVRPDGSASLIARALVDSPSASPAELAGQGVTWQRRATLVYSQGTLAKVTELGFGDDSLRIRERIDANKLTVHIKPGPTAAWVNALVPSQEKRREFATIYDPRTPDAKIDPTRPQRPKELGDTLRLEIVLPNKVNSSAVLPTARGVEVGREGNRAYLTIPVETAREKGDELQWDITWAEGQSK